MAEKIKSTYDRIMDEAMREGRVHIVSEEQSIKIMQELCSDPEPPSGIVDGNIFPSEEDLYLK